MRLQGKTALVTGSTSGIGQAIAAAFANEGAHVIVTGRDAHRGMMVVEQIERAGGAASFVPADVSRPEDARRLAEEAVAQVGGIDILVNNAGTYSFGPTDAIDEDVFDTMMNTNVKGPFFLTAAIAPAMAARGGGKVVNVTTAAAHTGVVGGAAYGASKAALGLLTKSWAKEYGPSGVNVNAISPGPVKTPGTDAMGEGFDHIVSSIPVQRAASAEEIAAAAVFLASDDAAFIHGATLAVDGGMLA